MFWGVSLYAGMKYSQVSRSTLIITMAALEPKSPVDKSIASEESSDKLVCLMIEKHGNEYLICTLEHGKVMQTLLNLHIDKGEEYVIFFTGVGVLHLSGYITEEKLNRSDSIPFAQYKEMKEPSCILADDDDDDSKDENGDDSKDENDEDSEEEHYVSTRRLLSLDDSAEEDNVSEEWEPSVSELEDTFGCEYMYGSRPRTRSKLTKSAYFVENNAFVSDESYMLPQLDVDEPEDGDSLADENEDTDDVTHYENGEENIAEGNEEVDEEEVVMKEPAKKRKKATLTNSQSKRSKKDEVSSVCIEYVGSTSSSKKSKKMKKEKSRMEDSDVREDDILNSSIGRTPMPKNKPSGSKKSSFTIQDSPISSGKSSAKKSLKFRNKLSGGVEYDDLRVGMGPMARSGKIVHVYYTGRLTDGRQFETCTPNDDKPYAFRLGRGDVIKGWDVAIEGMKVGGKRKMKIPPSMAYGKVDVGAVPPNSTVVYTVELMAVS